MARKPSSDAPKAGGRARQTRAAQAQPLGMREKVGRRLRIAWRIAMALLIGITALDVLFIAGVLDRPMLEDLWPFRQARTERQFITDPSAPLAEFYAPAVLHWQDAIERWATQYDVNPNVIAIVMQIESCGDPEAISGAGALGLMQVMPFHFEDGENMINPETNVQRGMFVFHECLSEFAGWDLGLALACYNGGAGVTLRDMSTWAAETQSYYRWATGMWNEVVGNRTSSSTLDEWLSAGGSRLCQQALGRLQAANADDT